MTEPDQRQRLTLEGKRLEAAWWGPPPAEAPTIVLLHEGLGSVGLWRDFPARLAQATGLGIFAFSRFGYGRSDSVPLPRPLDYMQREARDVLPRVLDQAGIGPCVLLGHSDGATIAALYSARVKDERVRGLILIAPHFFVEKQSLQAIAAIRREYEMTRLRDRLARHHDDPDAAFLGWAEAWLDPRFPHVLDLSADLPAIDVPVLILQGDADPYGTDAHARMAERLCAGPVRTVLLGASHAPHVEARARTLGEVVKFAGEVLPSRR
jgi:pimeloyl-ACP methyl ester carboxylesterase